VDSRRIVKGRQDDRGLVGDEFHLRDGLQKFQKYAGLEPTGGYLFLASSDIS
jgi:hypothetical protein